MDAVLHSGLDVIRTIQTIHSPALDSFFRVVTSLGDAEAYIFLLPLLFWCFDTRLGAHAGLLFLLSSYTGNTLKDLFQVRRPYTLDPSVKLGEAEGYSLPSYHAQEAVVMWGFFALWVKRWWFWAVAVAIMLMIGFSRLYLGVHYPLDVLAAYVFGGLFLVVYYFGRDAVEKALRRLSVLWQMVLVLSVTVLLMAIHPDFDAILIVSALSGLSFGLVLLGRLISFDAGGPAGRRVARYIAGGLVIVVLYLGPRFVETTPVWIGQSCRAIGYWLIGWWIAFGAPWFFLKTSLAAGIEGGRHA